MEKLKSVLFVALTVVFICGCGARSRLQKENAIIVPGGTLSPTLGVGFDATYDPTLDNIVPGYKIMNVAYTNNSMNLIQMSPDKDEWYIVDRNGKTIKAITNLRNADPDAWGQLPKKLKVLIEYPLLVPIGTTQTIDLLFRDHLNLGEFRAVIFKVAGSNTVYKILPRGE